MHKPENKKEVTPEFAKIVEEDLKQLRDNDMFIDHDKWKVEYAELTLEHHNFLEFELDEFEDNIFIFKDEAGNKIKLVILSYLPSRYELTLTPKL